LNCNISDLSAKIQIISLFRHIWFTTYKRLLSDTRNDLKGNSVRWTRTPK